MAVRSPAGKKTLVYGKDYLLGADPLRERSGRRRCAGRVRRLRRECSRARVRRLRGRHGRERQGRGVPERCAGDAPEQRARVLLVRCGEGGRGDQAGRHRHDQLHVAGRSAIPLGCERRDRETGQLRVGGCAGESQSRRSGTARVGVPQPFGSGGALCRCAEASGGGFRRRRQEHAAGVRPGDPRVAGHALDPQGRGERQPRRAPRGQRPGAEG